MQRRLKALEQTLYWTGSVGRSDLIARFGISPQQASADLKAYLTPAGETVCFNGSTRRYETTAGFAPRWIQGTLEEYERWAGSGGAPLVAPPVPLRYVAVFPAPAGMNRVWWTLGRNLDSVPRACGDEPMARVQGL